MTKLPDKTASLPPARDDLSRRTLLAQGTRLVAAGSLGALLATLGWPEPAAAQDWFAHSRSNPTGGQGTVKKLRGQATANGRPLAAGSTITSGEEIAVARKSFLILSLSDQTIMRINQRTAITLEIGRNRSGLFRLLVGSLLTVMPNRNRYLAQLPSVVIGIKGTVFFQQIYHPGERFARDEKNRRVEIPPGISEYFCLCNGLADYLDAKAANLDFTDVSYYHNSYYIDPQGEKTMVEAPQLNHTDEEIRDLIARQEGTKHNSDFLDIYNY